MPRLGIKPMEVCSSGDCIAMEIVKSKGSLPLSLHCNKNILTINDCFTRYAIALRLLNESAESIINAIFGNYITVYGTPR